MTAHTIAHKWRRALLNGRGVRLTAEEVRWSYEMGLLECIGLFPPGRSAPPPSLTPPWPKHEVVYFIGPEGGPVKIGYASDFHNRFRHLKYMNPQPLHVWALVPGSMADEKRFHHRFAALRLHGEWFERGEELDAAIRISAVEMVE